MPFCAHTHTHSMHTLMCLYTDMLTHITHLYSHTYTRHTPVQHRFMHTQQYMFTPIYPQIYTHAYSHIHLHIWSHTHKHAYTQTHVCLTYIYICTYTSRLTHLHIHMHMCTHSCIFAYFRHAYFDANTNTHTGSRWLCSSWCLRDLWYRDTEQDWQKDAELVPARWAQRRLESTACERAPELCPDSG